MAKRAFKNLVAARQKAREEVAGVRKPDVVTTNNSLPTSARTSTDENESKTPEIRQPIDLLEASPITRKALAQGKSIEVYVGNVCITNIPHRLLSAASTKYNDSLPSMNAVHLPQNVDKPSALRLLQWVKGTTTKNKVFRLRFNHNLDDAIRTCYAAFVLGMEKYVQHIMIHHKKMIMNGTPKTDEMALVENLSVNGFNKFLFFVADRVAFLVRKNQVQEKEYLAIMEQFPKILSEYHRINAPWAQWRKAQNLVEARRVAEQQKASEQKARTAKEKLERKARAQHMKSRQAELRGRLIEKMGQKIVVLTREELDLAAYLKARGDPAFLKR